MRGFRCCACWREVLVRFRCEFYVHLNLVRSCETPSDPTRCPLPPWVPLAADRGLSRPRGSCGILAALATRAACAVCAASVRLALCLAAVRVACESVRVLAASVSFRLHPRNPRRVSRCASLILSHPVRPVCFRAVPRFLCVNASQSSGLRCACQVLSVPRGVALCLAALYRVSGH
ncbi:hypothetical protein SnaR1_gp50 [Sphaerotilus phage vB_SnaP-R1]|uniref:Uncharacterized protein n=1 Tax=Sphaerotilus phage vB_SnaP-R1 TaxID=2696336 RepID=A0A6B9SUL8_9CAUD|nr:hypothetical protein SnaR1_gp50 [Sphaerotilus phage vB_SnaP-R1]